MKFLRKTYSLTGFHLKYIAMLTMTFDHFAAVFLPWSSPVYTLLRGIGRIAFPLYCYLLVEGFLHTSNKKAYFSRLFLFAILSEIPFDMALFGFPLNTVPASLFSHQNVFFTLAFAFLSMWIIENSWFNGTLTGILWVIPIALFSEVFHFDYGLTGIIVVLLMYLFKRYRTDMAPLYGFVLSILPLIHTAGPTGICPLLALPFLMLYQGMKGSPLPGGRTFPGAKYLFYFYYPLHLALFGIIHLSL